LSPQRWAQIEELFHRAVECKPEERARLLDESCSGDAELRREVEALLSSRESAEDDLQAAVRQEVHAIGFPLAGETISHYRILEGLGGGGMGVVYKAEDIKLGRRVALKLLPEDLSTDPVALERFEREARAASALEHPNICPIYEFGEHEGRPFIVMPLLEGQTLREWIARPLTPSPSPGGRGEKESGFPSPEGPEGRGWPAGPGEGARGTALPIDTLLDLAAQIADGLDAAHSKGIIHRDIKPANIFITTRGEVKILDFGLAKMRRSGVGVQGSGENAAIDPEHLTHPGAAMGTVAYMSPEQARGERLDARTDLFSFGAVLFEMATGRQAFGGSTPAVIFDAILNRAPEPITGVNPQLPPELERIISKSLQKDREARYQSAGELLADLKVAGTELVSHSVAALGTPPLQRWAQGVAPLRRWVLAGALVALAAAVGTYVYLRPNPSPRVLRTFRLTQFGRVEAWERLASDGPQLYFEQRTGGLYGVGRVSAEGGEPTELATPSPETYLYDISPDHSELLVGSATGGDDELPIWILPASGGSPRRLGDVITHDAAWAPDGQKIVYASGCDLYLVKPDGSGPQKLVSTAGRPFWPRWSPDGRVLRFTLQDRITHFLSLWEVSGEGRNLHRLLAGWREGPTAWADGESGGDWTPGGRYFIFRSARAGLCSIWAIREKGGFLGRRSSAPVLLTTTDSYVYNASAAQNGKRVFFVGAKHDRELERYDARLKQFVPYLSGVPRWVSFSRDGQWVAYTTVGHGGALWRSRVDGSDRQQLTFPPMGAGLSTWSPDGRRIAFAGPSSRIYLVPSDGGNPEPVTPEGCAAYEPDWSPDGNSLAFSAQTPDAGIETGYLDRLDLRTHDVTQLPGSKELRGPAYSPDGKYLAAVGGKDRRLMLFDFQSQRWTELAHGDSLWVPPYWSRDGKYVYAHDLSGEAQPLFRVRISDHKVEVITTWNQFNRADAKAYSLAGLTPDGSPLVSLIRSQDDIYALDVDFP